MKTNKHIKKFMGNISLEGWALDDVVCNSFSWSEQETIELSKLTLEEFSEVVRQAFINSLPKTFDDSYHELQCEADDITGNTDRADLKNQLIGLLDAKQKRLYKELHG